MQIAIFQAFCAQQNTHRNSQKHISPNMFASVSKFGNPASLVHSRQWPVAPKTCDIKCAAMLRCECSLTIYKRRFGRIVMFTDITQKHLEQTH